MKQLYLAFLSVISFSIFGNAQSDAKAKAILDEVSKKVKSLKGISAGFSIKSVSSNGRNNGTKTGTISIKGSKYYLKQGKVEIICNGATIWNYDGDKTVTVSSVDDDESTLSPQKLLSNFYDKDFTYKLKGTVGNFHEIEMLPTDKRKNYSQVNVFVDKTKNMITKAKIVDKSKNIIEFNLSNIKSNIVLDDKMFLFIRSKYPDDVEVLD